MRNFHSVRGLAAGLLATSALCAPGLAFAQQAAPARDGEASQVDEVVVTGQRAAVRAAIAVKRAEFEVMDAVSSDDIGKLPDHNTAAALRRIPGVSVQEDQGEPRFPVLRGLTSTYNRTTIDGAIVASVDEAARTVPLDIVPSVMAGRVEVIKTVTPENDGNAIGGVINITTRSALDVGRPFFNGMASYGVYEQNGDVRNDEPSYRLSFAAGKTFGANDEWGVVVGASHEQLDYDIPQMEVADPSVREYTAAGVPVNSGAPTGNGIQVPTQSRLFWYNNTKTRDGVNGKIEWRPNASFHWEASGLWAHMEDDEERIEYRIEPVGNVTNQTATSGAFASGRGIIGLNQPITKREISLARTAFQWDATSQWAIDGSLVYSHAKMEQPNTSVTFTTRDAQAANYGFSYDTSGFFPVFTPRTAGLTTASSYFLTQYRDSLVQSFENTTQVNLNAAFDDGGADRNLKAKVGLALRTSDRDYQSARTDYANSAFNFDSVDRPGPSALIHGNLVWARIDVASTYDYFNANRSSFTRMVAARSGDYSVSEDVSAAYGQASYRVGTFTALAGVRYEETEVSADAFSVRSGVITPVSNDGDYGNWLPSVHLRWDLMDNLTLRAAWTNTIGRPNFGSLAGAENVTVTGGVYTMSRGNPDLKPRESEGFDLSAEFYPHDGLISVAVFSKEIANEIFTLTSQEQIELDGQVRDVTVTTPRNASGASIRGIELAFQQELSMLPAPFDGFGVSANATFLDTDFTFLTNGGAVERHHSLFLQPGTTTNESIYYQRGPFEAKISHNYIGGFLETVNDTIPNADQFWKGRHLYDASVSWRTDRGVTVFFEAQNLSNSGRQENTGPGARYLQESAEYGRTFWVGLSAAF
ncbi:TonB-dependent receptor [Brevundimonas goettingensis]|uniref:TonB-dependent receptor n=1 Tax=Brevundimonas goettingensis TaxID=2774190 RepID=A0A975C341_9CAUL|nr:TonB-dependent receptor [Brevundimonas goettingensis]QTC92956.1 TonB-dependent receptor [Brevundimonas goettingensis]